MTEAERRSWEAFFRGATGLVARYALKSLSVRGPEARALVDASYVFAPASGGAQREERPRLDMRLEKTANGWRITKVSDVR